MEARLKSEFWVKAHLRRCEASGASAMLVRRGEESSGAVLIRLTLLNGRSRILVRGLLDDGRPGWRSGTGPDPVPDAEADAYIARQISYDPDLWVIEIEDRDGRPFLDEPVGA